jgi:hypothetical protein
VFEITPDNLGVHVKDCGFYRAKLNILPPSAVRESPPVPGSDHLAISIYPNPAPGAMRVRIGAPDQVMASVEVLDILGRSVIESRAETNSDFSLDLHSLPNGVYLLRCESGNQSASRNFTIEK